MGMSFRKESDMLMKKFVIASAATGLLVSAAPAFADPPRWAPAHGYWHKKQKHYHRYHRPVVLAQPYYYAPEYVTRPPVVVYRPPVVVYRQQGVSVTFGF
jgi:hypothetical protein